MNDRYLDCVFLYTTTECVVCLSVVHAPTPPVM